MNKPLAIENTLKNDYLSDPALRALQLESKAHIEVQLLIEERQQAYVCSHASVFQPIRGSRKLQPGLTTRPEQDRLRKCSCRESVAAVRGAEPKQR